MEYSLARRIRMIHAFETDIAKDVGVIPAILFNNILHWIKKNEANGKKLIRRGVLDPQQQQFIPDTVRLSDHIANPFGS